MRFLFDMNLSPAWIDALGAAGYEAVHWRVLGKASAPDGDIADYAREHGYILVTADLDFGKLLAADRTRLPSVIQLRLGDLRPATLLETFRRTVARTEHELQTGALVTIGAKRVRVTSLPIDHGEGGQ